MHLISTVLWDGTEATGDSESTLAIQDATTTISDDQRSITFTMAHIAGVWTADKAGITVEKSSTDVIVDSEWGTTTYVVTTIEEVTTTIRMGQRTRTTVQEVSVINNDGTLMDLETTSTTPHEGVRHVRRWHNLTTVTVSVATEALVVQQEALSQVDHSVHQATALVAEVHPSVEAVQVAETYQTEVVLSVDIDKDNNK